MGDRRHCCANLPGVRWLVVSVAVSIVLTVVMNVGLRAFPGAGRRIARRLAELTWPDVNDSRRHRRDARLFLPWKAMLVGSVILTIVVNLVLWII